MKKVLVSMVAAVLVVLAAGSAFAQQRSGAHSLSSGSVGISVGMGDSIFARKAYPLSNSMVNDVVDINARYFTSSDMAIYGGLGLQIDSGDADGTYLSVTAGMRKYFKADTFSTFAGGQISIIMVDADVPQAELDIIDISVYYGAEYFLAKQFSLEGAVGLGIGQASFGNQDDVYFGTRTLGVRANFYF